jgi:hypothetical protein
VSIERKNKRKLECLGGPLCGKKWPRMGRFVWVDDDGCPHYYRKINVARNDHSAVATFFHYFGTDMAHASTAHPSLLPGDRLYRPMI